MQTTTMEQAAPASGPCHRPGCAVRGPHTFHRSLSGRKLAPVGEAPAQRSPLAARAHQIAAARDTVLASVAESEMLDPAVVEVLAGAVAATIEQYRAAVAGAGREA